jgi:arylsulfatase A-like enzyme
MESGLYLPENDPNVVNSKQDFDPIDKFLWPNMRFGVSFNNGKWFKPARYLTDYFTDEAVTAIKRNKNQPFFLYLAHWGVHTPLQASKADYDALSNIPDHRRRVYLAMVRAIDRSVGRVLQTLRDEGLDDNTIVIFTSDNGAPGYIGLPEVNQPYRGWKLTLFEGGVHVPYVAKWPGHIPAGTRYQPPVSNIDVLPTVVATATSAVLA